jgi:arylsulfatase A-like enzyme
VSSGGVMRSFSAKTRIWVVWVVALAAFRSVTATQGSEQPAPPNVLLIVADDLGFADVGFHGRREWATPNLDRLASRGLILDRCYSAAPICGPSRAAILSGRVPERTGVRLNHHDLPATEITIAEVLRPLAYRSAAIGKWQRGQPFDGSSAEGVHPLDQGFSQSFGFLDAMHAFEKFPAFLWDSRDRVEVTGYADDLFTDRALQFISSFGDQPTPFFLYLAYTAPHFNLDAPAEEVALHQSNIAEADPAVPINATYAAMVTQLDRQVGRLMDVLDATGQSQNTLIIFTSDHGATFEGGNRGASRKLDSNRPFRGQKRTLWEGGLRVPAFVVWPGRIKGGQRSQEVVSLLDLFPTIAAAAQAVVDGSTLDGINQLKTWTTGAKAEPRLLTWEWRGEGADQVAALWGSLKLVINGSGRAELFDVVEDPSERLDRSAEHPELTDRLLQTLESRYPRLEPVR